MVVGESAAGEAAARVMEECEAAEIAERGTPCGRCCPGFTTGRSPLAWWMCSFLWRFAGTLNPRRARAYLTLRASLVVRHRRALREICAAAQLTGEDTGCPLPHDALRWFDFARFLRLAQGQTVVEVLHITPTTWFGILCLVIPAMIFDKHNGIECIRFLSTEVMSLFVYKQIRGWYWGRIDQLAQFRMRAFSGHNIQILRCVEFVGAPAYTGDCTERPRGESAFVNLPDPAHVLGGGGAGGAALLLQRTDSTIELQQFLRQLRKGGIHAIRMFVFWHSWQCGAIILALKAMSRDQLYPHWSFWCVPTIALAIYLQFHCLGHLIWMHTVLHQAYAPSEDNLVSALHHPVHGEGGTPLREEPPTSAAEEGERALSDAEESDDEGEGEAVRRSTLPQANPMSRPLDTQSTADLLRAVLHSPVAVAPKGAAPADAPRSARGRRLCGAPGGPVQVAGRLESAGPQRRRLPRWSTCIARGIRGGNGAGHHRRKG